MLTLLVYMVGEEEQTRLYTGCKHSVMRWFKARYPTIEVISAFEC